jgi:hypothetical protein
MKQDQPHGHALVSCAEREATKAELLHAIDKYVRITSEQVDLLKAGDFVSAMQLVRELEQTSLEENRALTALLRHLEEHGC